MTSEALTTVPEQAEQAKAQARFRWLIAPLTAFLVTRVLIVAIILLGDTILPGFNDISFYPDGNIPAGFVNAWNRWDTPRYLSIVEDGYSYVPGYDRNNVVYFPLYPLGIASLMPVTGGNPLLAGLIISNVCFLAALLLLYRLVVLKTGDEDVASRTVFYAAAFPTAFFYAAVYTESLFLLLSVAVAFFALRRQWLWAGIFGALASATRVTGVLLVIVVGYEWLAAHGWTFSRIRDREAWQNLVAALRKDWLSLLPILLIPLGVVAYSVYLGLQFGDPLAWVHAQSGWRQPSDGQAFLNDIGLFLSGKLWPSYIIDMVVSFVVMALALPIGRRFGAGYALYVAISVFLPALSGVMSMTRYATVLFPVFMLLALWVRNARVDRVIRIVFLLFFALFLLAFVKNVLVG